MSLTSLNDMFYLSTRPHWTFSLFYFVSWEYIPMSPAPLICVKNGRDEAAMATININKTHVPSTHTLTTREMGKFFWVSGPYALSFINAALA